MLGVLDGFCWPAAWLEVPRFPCHTMIQLNSVLPSPTEKNSLDTELIALPKNVLRQAGSEVRLAGEGWIWQPPGASLPQPGGGRDLCGAV